MVKKGSKLSNIICLGLCVILLLTAINPNLVRAGELTSEQTLNPQNEEVSDLIPNIEVRPGIEVEVNEEVFFSGEGTTYPDAYLLNRARYEWDFGDGYTCKFGAPRNTSSNSGLAVTHYYMTPGIYTVTLSVSIFDKFTQDFLAAADATVIAYETTSIQITVTGEKPMDGFELCHAPFNTRSAQFITATIPSNVVAEPTNILNVSLVGDKPGNTWELLHKNNLQTEVKFLADYSELPADTYHLCAVLTDASGNKLGGVWNEKFSKSYDGIAKVSINEWNAICVDGEPFYPVSAYMIDLGWMNDFEDSLNTANTIGYYNTEGGTGLYTPELWADYLDKCADRNWMAIGPGRGDFTVPSRNGRTTSISKMRNFVTETMEHNRMLMWCWMDEPDIGGMTKQVPPHVLSAWTYATREIDDQHPVTYTTTVMGALAGASRYQREYEYWESTEQNNRHTFFCDVLSFDLYPLEYRIQTKGLFNKERGVIDLWAESIDTYINQVAGGMLPVITVIEPCDLDASRNTPGPTSEQVLMESWLSVVHGAKGVQYFAYFERDTIQYDAMSEFKTGMETYGKIILSADLAEEEWITDNSNVRNNRVDTMTKKDGDDIYLFTVRLTEPEPLSAETNHIAAYDEDKTILTTFTVPGITSGKATVLNASGEEIETIGVVNGQFSDTYEQEDYRIYRIELSEDIQPIPGDMNNDGVVNIVDLAFVARHIDKTDESDDWESVKKADMNNDNKINIVDLSTVARLIQ